LTDALAYHSAPRYTNDIDLYIKRDIENTQGTMRALDFLNNKFKKQGV